MDKRKLVIKEGIIMTMMKYIKAKIDKLPTPIKMAVAAQSQYWINRALNYKDKGLSTSDIDY